MDSKNKKSGSYYKNEGGSKKSKKLKKSGVKKNPGSKNFFGVKSGKKTFFSQKKVKKSGVKIFFSGSKNPGSTNFFQVKNDRGQLRMLRSVKFHQN